MRRDHLLHAICALVCLMIAMFFTLRASETDVFVFVGSNLTRPFDMVAVAALKDRLKQSMPKDRAWRLDEYYLEDYKKLGDSTKEDPAALYQSIGWPGKDKPLFVFDNLPGSQLMKALPKIEELKLDVIALNGDRNQAGGRVIYLDPDNFSCEPVTDYATKVLAQQSDYTDANFVCIGEVLKNDTKYPVAVKTHGLLKNTLKGRESHLAEVWVEESVYNADVEANKKRKPSEPEHKQMLEALDKALEEEQKRLKIIREEKADVKKNNADKDFNVSFDSKTIYVISVHGQFGNTIIEHLAAKCRSCIYLGAKFIITNVSANLIRPIRAGKNRLILLQRPFDRISSDDRDLLRGLQSDQEIKPIADNSSERALINCERVNLAWLLIEPHITDRSKPKPYDEIQPRPATPQASSLIRKETLMEFDSSSMRVKPPLFGEYRLDKERDDCFHFITCEYQLAKDYFVADQQPNKPLAKDLPYSSNIFASLDIVSIKSVQESLNTFTADLNLTFLIRIDQHDCSKVQSLFPDIQVVGDGSHYVFLKGDITSATVKDVAMPPWVSFSNGDVVNLINGRASIEDFFLRVEYPVSGTFFADYKMRDFPFDDQTLEVRLRAPSEFHLSMESISDQVAAIFGSHTTRGGASIINGWHLIGSESDVRERTFKFRTDFAELKDSPKIRGDQEIVSSVRVERERSWGWTRIMLPYSFIAIGILILTSLSVSALGNSRETSLALFLAVLSLAVSHLATAPQVNTVTKADLMYLMVFTGGLLNFLLTTLYHSCLLKAAPPIPVWSRWTDYSIRTLIFMCILGGVLLIFVWL